MKLLKNVVLSSVLLFSCTCLFAQPSVVMGIKLGSKTSKGEIISALGSNARYNDSLSTVMSDGERNYCIFDDARLYGTEYMNVLFGMLPDGTLVTVSYAYIYALEKDNDYSSFVEKYEQSRKRLESRFNFYDIPQSDTTARMSLGYSESDMMGCIINTFTSNGKIDKFVITYMADSLYSGLIDQILELPKLQDTFFGIKLGDKINLAKIKAAVGDKMENCIEEKDGDLITFTCSDIFFAGEKWNFGEFTANNKGTFFSFRVNNSYPDGLAYQEERKESDKIFKLFKDKLDMKYGTAKEEIDDEGNISAYYLGKNKMQIKVSNERSKSRGGTYRRYVTLAFTDFSIYEEVRKSYDNEL